MSNSIEILENTILQVIIRQGVDSDRLNVKFKLGELVVTSDTNRLYVGDGNTYGGKLVGNKFLGSSADITSVTPASIGDLAYDSDNFKLYRLITGDGSNISDWELIGGVFTAGDSTINVSSDNKISVGMISAGNIDLSLCSNPLYIDGTSKLALSSNLRLDSIYPKNSTHLSLTPKLSVGNVAYTFPLSAPTVGQFLYAVDNAGGLAFGSVPLSSISNTTWTIANGLTARVNGANVTGVGFNPLTATTVAVGVTPTLSAYTLWARYSGSTSTLLANRGITSASRTGLGKYTFTYDALPTVYPSAVVQIIGTDNRRFEARVTSINDIQCDVEVAQSNVYSTIYVDSEISLQIFT